jgi:hypothetical protein
MGLNGTFFDAKKVKQPSITPVTFALRDPKGKDAQFFLTSYTIKTALKLDSRPARTLTSLPS